MIDRAITPVEGAIVLKKQYSSADKTVVPPAEFIIDNEGAKWELSGVGTIGGCVIHRNGKWFPGGGRLMAWSNGKVYLLNTSGAWFIAVESGWVPSGKPEL